MRSIVITILCLLGLIAKAQTDTVHVIFKTHLDVGFTDFASKVIERYTNDYIPQAIHTARELEKEGKQKYIWTTGSWIISENLKNASVDKQKELEAAIDDGLICWNAYPFTAHDELMDSSLFSFALSISNDLDKRFNKHTSAAKITDVPGETIGAVNILQKNGVKMLHIGVNPASTIPETPPVFLWKDQQGNEVIVLYNNDYGGTFKIKGFNHILNFEFTGDNKGAHTPEEVKAIYKKLADKFPNAVIIASTLNDYANLLRKIRDSLPVINEEIGDTWIHGAGTDPKKYAEFRALMRLRTKWISEKKVSIDDPKFKEFSTYLLLLAEHTGGLDEKSNIDFNHYNVAELAEVLDKPEYRRMEQSWDDARSYVTKAVEALGDSPLADEAKIELAKLNPNKPHLNEFSQFTVSKELQTNFFTVKFDTLTGAISSLYDKENNKQLTSDAYPLGLFWHESFSENDYQHWAEQYLTIKEQWVNEDFCKPNVDQHGAVSAIRLPKLMQTFIKNQQDGITILMLLKLEEAESTLYGFPNKIWIKVEFPHKNKEIHYTVEWFNKKPTRLPESYWFSMGFSVDKPDCWKIEKINRLISPLNVVSKGSRNLHGFNRGVVYSDGKEKIFVESLDCPIVAPGSPSLLDFNNQLPDMTKGWHFNILNNKWGTNFPTWYSDDAKFRFIISFE